DFVLAQVGFVRIDAPDDGLVYPALETIKTHLAPFAVTSQNFPYGARFHQRYYSGIFSRVAEKLKRCLLVSEPGRRHAGASAGEERLIDPAFGPLIVAHPAPIVIFLHDLERQALAQVKP